MSYLDFLLSEYDYCLNRYEALGFASYMERMLRLEALINEYKQNSTDLIELVA